MTAMRQDRLTEHDIDATYRRHIVMVRKRACRILNNEAAAQDVAQEVFVKYLIHHRDNGPERDAPSFLFRMTTNLALNRLRDGQRRRGLLERVFANSASTVPAMEEAMAMRQILTRVNDEEAQIAVYYYIDGMQQDEIADLLQLQRRTVGNRLESFRRRARRMLGLQEDKHVA